MTEGPVADRNKPMYQRPKVWIYEDLYGAFEHGSLKMWPHQLGGSRGEWYIPEADHLAKLATKDEEIEQEKQRVGRWEDRCSEAVYDLGEAEEEIERLKEAWKGAKRVSKRAVERAKEAEQALPAELEKQAEEFEKWAVEQRNNQRRLAYHNGAIRLRERAAELRSDA